MAFDEALAARVRTLVPPHASERKMFGGLAFLLEGHMSVVVSGRGGLMVRVGPDAEHLIASTAAEPVQMGPRTMGGFVRVAPEHLEHDLAAWVARGVAFAESLPPKTDG